MSNSILSEVRSEPRLVGRYARSAWQSRVLGPATAARRPGAVAIFHAGRCGSTVLTDQMEQHSAVYSDGETYVRVIEAARADGIHPDETGIDPVRYVAERLRRSGRHWFMYDLKFDHVTRLGMSLAEYVERIAAVGVDHWVVLRRRNLLRKLVSGLMAGERGAYHSTDPAAVERLQIHIDVDAVWMDGRLDSITGHFHRVNALYDEFAVLTKGRDVLSLGYEADISENPGVAYDKTLAFLGLESTPAEVRLQRLNPFALGDVIDNFGEVEAALNGTEHAWMINA